MMTIMLWFVALQSVNFSFAGIGLDSDFNQVAKRYPHSMQTGSYIYVAAQDSHDHISGIGISGEGAARTVRISFEFRPAGKPLDYPSCEEVQAKIEKQFGRPSSILNFNEEASRRRDRIWRSATQEMLLMCFAGSGGRWVAEAIQINRR